MRNLLATLALLAIVIAVGFYAAGWLRYHKTDKSANIEIKTEQIEETAGRAAQRGKELLEDVLEQPVNTVEPVQEKPVSRSELEEPVT